MNIIRTLIIFSGILLTLHGRAIAADYVPSADFEEKAKGEMYQSSKLKTYPVPEAYPVEGKSLFQVCINGKYTGIYNDINGWNNLISFGYFDLKSGEKASVDIVCSRPFSNYKILPENSKVNSSCEGQTIRLKMKANQTISIVFDDDYQGNVLHLFANAMEEEVPQPTDDLIYFGPGYHHLDEVLKISGKQQVYIAGGAVVNGTIHIEKSDGAKIYGRGMLMKKETGNVVLSSGFSKNVTIGGILIHNHRRPGWTVALHAVSGFQVKNVKVVSPRYASTDGFDIVNSNNVHFNNVFIRACDDAIAIKGLIPGKPADCPPNENMTFENLQLWSDCNNAMCLGAETRAAYYRNIHFKDIDVLYSFDDRDNHTKLDERSVMTIVCLDGTFFENISYENIRVNRCERLICLTFKDSFWFGTLLGNQSTQGKISNITYKNISSHSTSNSSIANEILLNGWHKEGTPMKYIEDITFQNVNILGKKITDEKAPYIKNNNTDKLILVRNLYFKK